MTKSRPTGRGQTPPAPQPLPARALHPCSGHVTAPRPWEASTGRCLLGLLAPVLPCLNLQRPLTSHPGEPGPSLRCSSRRKHQRARPLKPTLPQPGVHTWRLQTLPVKAASAAPMLGGDPETGEALPALPRGPSSRGACPPTAQGPRQERGMRHSAADREGTAPVFSRGHEALVSPKGHRRTWSSHSSVDCVPLGRESTHPPADHLPPTLPLNRG